jgi:hypothetical protein
VTDQAARLDQSRRRGDLGVRNAQENRVEALAVGPAALRPGHVDAGGPQPIDQRTTEAAGADHGK